MQQAGSPGPGAAQDEEHPGQRLRVRYAKRGRLRFASHRDIARAVERAVRRAGLPIAYSAGFSPHPKISYAGAAPTGVASEAEFLELTLTTALPDADVRDQLDGALPDGLDVINVTEANSGQLASNLEASVWEVQLPGVPEDAAAAACSVFLAARSVEVERLTSKGVRRMDARAPVVELEAGGPGPAEPQPGTAELRPGTPELRPGTAEPRPGPAEPRAGTSKLPSGTASPLPGGSRFPSGKATALPGASRFPPGAATPLSGGSRLSPGTATPLPGTTKLQPGDATSRPPGPENAQKGAGCAILRMVVRHVTPAVRPDDVLAALRQVSGLVAPSPPLVTRLAQGPLAEVAGGLAEPRPAGFPAADDGAADCGAPGGSGATGWPEPPGRAAETGIASPGAAATREGGATLGPRGR